MKKLSLQLLSLFVFTLFCSTLYAQPSKLIRAKEFYKAQQFESVLSLLSTDRDLMKSYPEAQFLTGLAYYQVNNLTESERILKDLANRNAPYKEGLLYLGRIYHARNQFEEASRYYKIYLKSIDSKHQHRAMVRDAIRRCSNGIRIQFNQPIAFAENLGATINTKHDEFGINLSPNFNNKIYFSSARAGSLGGKRNKYGQTDDLLGKYTCDIYLANKVGGKWQNIQAMTYLINTPKEEVVFGFSNDGKVLYYYRGSALERGQIFVDTFQQNNQLLKTDPFFGPVDPQAHITAPHFFDATTIVFSSRKAGGFGGYDLYQTTFIHGKWTPPKNLGPDINSAYDEVSPFLSADRKTLYFSTNNSKTSIGGFDIFKSIFNPQQVRWSRPYNLGIPINSAGDDTHLKLAKDGYTAYFTSNRKDGYGMRDLYVVYFFDYLNEIKPN